jgi:GTPase SAR1 family protein
MQAIKTLCLNSDKFGKMSGELDVDRKQLEETGEDEALSPKIVQCIKRVWADKGIQETFTQRSKFQLSDSSSFFLDKIEAVAEENYIPTEMDVLRARVPTTGIVEHEFQIGKSVFKMFDVGGQRSERKKWIHCFENVTAVLFVAAINEYDQTLFEDNVTNRMMEALKLFDDVCNSPFLSKVAFILFLNKKDLFSEKVKTVPISKFFPDFDAKLDFSYSDGAAFFKDKFLALNTVKGRAIYHHVTCGTDTNNIRAVFKAVRDIVIRKGLAESGLME